MLRAKLVCVGAFAGLASGLAACTDETDRPPAVEALIARELTARWALLSHRISALELTYEPEDTAVIAQNDGGGFGAVDTPEAVYGYSLVGSRHIASTVGSVRVAIPPGSEVDGEPFSAVGTVELPLAPFADATTLVAFLRGYRIETDGYESPPPFATDPDLPYDPAEGFTSQGIGIEVREPTRSDTGISIEVRVRNSLGLSDRADMNAAIPQASSWVRVDVVVVGAVGARATVTRARKSYFASTAEYGTATPQPRATRETQAFEAAGEPGLATAVFGLTAFDVWVNAPGHHEDDCVVVQNEINSWDEPVSGPGRYLREVGARLHETSYDAASGLGQGQLDLYVSNSSEFEEVGNLCAGLSGEVAMLQLDDTEATSTPGSVEMSFTSGERATEPVALDEAAE